MDNIIFNFSRKNTSTDFPMINSQKAKIEIVKTIDDIFDEIYKISFRGYSTKLKIYVMKIVEYKEKEELMLQHQCSLNDIAPKIIDYRHVENKLVIITENYLGNKSFGEYLTELTLEDFPNLIKIFKIVISVYKNIFFMNFVLGIYHNNIAPENIILNNFLEPNFINFIFDKPENKFSDITRFNKFLKDDFQHYPVFSLIDNILCKNIIEVAKITISTPNNKKEDIEKIFSCIEKSSIRMLKKIK